MEERKRKFTLDPEKPSGVIILMALQSVLFCLIGFGLYFFSGSDEIRSIIPSSFLAPIGPVALNVSVFLIASVWMAVANIAGTHIMMNHSDEYKQADKESYDKMKVVLDQPGPVVLLVLIMGAFSEEVLFRMGAFSMIAFAFHAGGVSLATSIVCGVVFSSLAFALMHNQYGNAAQLIQVAIAGIILCTGYLACGNVVTIALAHLVANISAIAIEPLLESKAPTGPWKRPGK